MLYYSSAVVVGGLGDILDLPTLYAIKYFNIGVLQRLQIKSLTTSRNDNSELYRRHGRS